MCVASISSVLQIGMFPWRFTVLDLKTRQVCSKCGCNGLSFDWRIKMTQVRLKEEFFLQYLCLSILEGVPLQSHVVFSLTFELSGSTVITSHTLTSWTIITAALSAIDKVPNGPVGDIEAPGFWPSWSTKQNHWTLQKLSGSANCWFALTSKIPHRLNILVRFWWIKHEVLGLGCFGYQWDYLLCGLPLAHSL